MFSGIEQVQYFKVNTLEYPKQLPLPPPLPLRTMQPWCLDVMVPSWQPLSSRVSSNKTWDEAVWNCRPKLLLISHPRVRQDHPSVEHMPWQKCHTKLLVIFLWIFMDIYGLSTGAYAFKLTKFGLVVQNSWVRQRGSSLVGVHRWNPSRSRWSFGIQHVFLLKDITVLLEVLKSCCNKLRINF